MSYAVRRWWDRVAQVRNELDASHNFHEAQALAMERAVNELIDNACSPWFENAAPQVPAMATSGTSGQNVGADREPSACHANGALCDERLAGGANPARAAPDQSPDI